MKPKVLLVPFADRFYPADLIDSLFDRCREIVVALNFELTIAPMVKNDVGEAMEVARLAETTGADLTLALIISWMEPSQFVAALNKVFHKPLLLWSLVMFPDDEVPGGMLTTGAFVAAATIRETLEEMDVPHKFIWGMPEKKEIQKAIAEYTRVAWARRRMFESRIGLFGYSSLGIYTGTADHVSLRQKIGPEIFHLDQWLIVKGMDEVPEAEAAEFADQVTRTCALGPNVTRDLLLKAGRMTAVLRKLAVENKLDAINVKCHYELSEILQFTACIPISFLSKDYVCSCEGDLMASCSQMMLHYLTGNETMYGDIHEVFSDRLTISCCGFGPMGMCDLSRCLISRYDADFQGLANSSPYIPDQRVTIARLAAKGDNYKMHITTGTNVDTFKWHEVTCPPMAATDVILDDDPIWFTKNISSNHYAMVYGDIRDQLIDLCELLGVRPVVYSRAS